MNGSSKGVGVLLINLGTPEAPTPEAVRVYLKEFLSDPRVVEIPRAVWWPILYLFILPRRPKASAARYAQVWTRDGSPLKVYAERQTLMLQGYLGERLRAPVAVDYAMRYGKPSIADKLQALRKRGCDRILLVPLYPQYAASTTATALDRVLASLEAMRDQPAVRTVRDFHDDPGYIEALAASVRDFWMKRGRPEVLVMSFHGIPKRSVDLGDPYRDQCLETGRLLAAALELPESRYRIAFQSRFGRAEWLKPYTAETLADFGRAGTAPVDVICPGFVADCLETLEEIAIEGRQIYEKAGGRELRYIPCLNDRHEWIAALTELTARNLLGWVEPGEAARNYRPFGVSAF
ncbi:MAG TPA: ferrochelatase [Burkholderiales bacterium]|nr:ferrochelatase [Burkholderiales bacterium]